MKNDEKAGPAVRSSAYQVENNRHANADPDHAVPRRARGRPRDQVDFQAVNRAARAILPVLLARWLPDGARCGQEWIARNPTRTDRRLGSFKINLRTGKWADFATGDKGGDVIALAAYLAGIGQAEAARRLADMLGARHG